MIIRVCFFEENRWYEKFDASTIPSFTVVLFLKGRRDTREIFESEFVSNICKFKIHYRLTFD